MDSERAKNEGIRGGLMLDKVVLAAYEVDVIMKMYDRQRTGL